MPFVYLNGRFVRADRARIGVFDRGLLYGDALFETLRVYRGVPFAVAGHLARLRAAGERIGLVVPGDDAAWQRILVGLLRRNDLATRDAALRVTVTRGEGREGLVPPRRVRPTVLVTARPLEPGLARLRREGVRVITLPFHPGVGGILAGLKTTSYLPAVLGKRAARAAGAYEALYTSPETDEVFEGTTSNVFLVSGADLVTPPVEAGILPGVTRLLVLELSRRAGLRPREQRVHTPALLRADEIFLTASTTEVMPVREIDGRRVGTGAPGPRARQLQKLYVALRTGILSEREAGV